MSTIRARAARDDEYAVWMPLWRGYQAFYAVDIAEDVSRLTWQRFFDPEYNSSKRFGKVTGPQISMQAPPAE